MEIRLRAIEFVKMMDHGLQEAYSDPYIIHSFGLFPNIDDKIEGMRTGITWMEAYKIRLRKEFPIMKDKGYEEVKIKE